MNYITAEGLQALKEELKALENERPEIVNSLNEARDQGDLSENFGYHAAKSKLKSTDSRIEQLRSKIVDASVVEVTHVDFVRIGAYVKACEDVTGTTNIFRIVGEDDAGSEKAVKYISWKSPVAKALLNKKVGDEIGIKIPAGERFYEILAIGKKAADVAD